MKHLISSIRTPEFAKIDEFKELKMELNQAKDLLVKLEALIENIKQFSINYCFDDGLYL
jgi:hypothetical protein